VRMSGCVCGRVYVMMYVCEWLNDYVDVRMIARVHVIVCI